MYRAGILSDPIADIVELRHPRLEQMAILEEDPVSVLQALIDEHCGCPLLALTQALLVEFLAEILLLGISQNFLVGVSSLAEHEDYWCNLVSRTEEDLHGGEWADRVDLAEVTDDVFSESLEQQVRLEQLNEQQLLKVGHILGQEFGQLIKQRGRHIRVRRDILSQELVAGEQILD